MNSFFFFSFIQESLCTNFSDLIAISFLQPSYVMDLDGHHGLKSYCILKNKVNIFIGLTFLWYSFEMCLGLFS